MDAKLRRPGEILQDIACEKSSMLNMQGTPVSAGGKDMRLQRASLRFQLFHQPGAVDEISTFRPGLGKALPRETSSPDSFRAGAGGGVRICMCSAGHRPEVASRIPSFGRRFDFESSMPHLVRTATSP